MGIEDKLKKFAENLEELDESVNEDLRIELRRKAKALEKFIDAFIDLLEELKKEYPETKKEINEIEKKLEEFFKAIGNGKRISLDNAKGKLLSIAKIYDAYYDLRDKLLGTNVIKRKYSEIILNDLLKVGLLIGIFS